MEEIRNGYIALFETAIDRALAGMPVRIIFCSDVVLELYLEDDELHWRKIDGECASNEERNNSP